MRLVINHISRVSQNKPALAFWRSWYWEKNAVLHPSVNVIKKLFSCHWHIVHKAVEKRPACQQCKEMFSTGWTLAHVPLDAAMGKERGQKMILLLANWIFDFCSVACICSPTSAMCSSLSFKHHLPLRHKQFIARELLYTKQGLRAIFHPLTYVNTIY